MTHEKIQMRRKVMAEMKKLDDVAPGITQAPSRLFEVVVSIRLMRVWTDDERRELVRLYNGKCLNGCTDCIAGVATALHNMADEIDAEVAAHASIMPETATVH